MTFRLLAGLGFAASVVALGFAYLLQYGFGLVPCPLCIFQRIAMAGFGLVALVGFLHGPRTRVPQAVYAGLGVAAALLGAAIAARHVWILHLPPSQVPACGPGLNYLVQIMPLHQVVATVLAGDASCADVKASFAGLSLPAWTGICFVGLAVVSLGVLVNTCIRRRGV